MLSHASRPVPAPLLQSASADVQKTLLLSSSSPDFPGPLRSPRLPLLLLPDVATHKTLACTCRSLPPTPSPVPLGREPPACSEAQGNMEGGGRPQSQKPALEEEKWNAAAAIPKFRPLEPPWCGIDTRLTALSRFARSNVLADLRQMWRGF